MNPASAVRKIPAAVQEIAMAPISHRTDADLLRGWRQGDANMGAQLFERHKTAVTNLLRRNVRSPSEVRDLLQQTFLNCLDSTHGELTGSVRGYLLGIAFHTMTRFFRKARNAPKFGLGDEGNTALVSIEPDPEYLLVLSDEQRLLMTAIRRLKIEFQVVLELHYWEDISCDEIARVLDIPQGTARSRLQHGRAALARKIAELNECPSINHDVPEPTETWRRTIQNWIAAQTALRKKLL